VVKQKDYEYIKNYLFFHPLVKNMKIGKKSFMAFIQIITNDGDILNIDLIWKLKRKNLNMLSAEPFVQESYLLENGVKIPQTIDLARYVGLFYGLNNAQIPNRYTGLVDYLEPENMLDKQLIFLFQGSKNYKNIKKQILKMSSNSPFRRISRFATYVIDTIRSLRFNKGLVVTFSGVDGAGKSTIIENVHFDIEKRLRRKVVILRHRPSILPILSAWTKGKAEAERQAASKLPRQGTNYGFVPSLFRFAYYYTDYFFGQFYVWAKYIMRGTVVLYDRYYFDFINDSRRSNINLPVWMVRFGYKFLMKPGLNIFLYADSKIILSRKKELDARTIEILTDKYLKLFNRLNNHNKHLKYISIENVDLQSTLKRIQYNIFEKIA
jgi:thymidylate kinase